MELPIYCRIQHGHSREEYVKHISNRHAIQVIIWNDDNEVEITEQNYTHATTHAWDYREERYTPCTEQEYLDFLDKAYQLIKSK